MMKMKIKGYIIITVLMFALISQATAASTTVNVADSKGAKGDNVKVPINVAGASNLGAMGIVLSYDPSVLKGIDANGDTLGANALIESKETKPGTMHISFADSKGISGDGALLDVTFQVVGDTGASTQVSLDATGYDVNLLDVQMKTSPGTFRVEEKSLPIVPIVIAAIVVVLIAVFVVKKFKKKK
jgi:hypothetical protein